MPERKVAVKDLSPVEKQIEVVVPSEEVEKAFASAVEKVRRQARIKGFRPGKAPHQIVEKMYGPQIGEEVAQEVVNRSFSDVIREYEIRAIDRPQVNAPDPAARGAAFKYEAKVEVLPPVELKKYKGLSANRPKITVDEEKVEQALDKLREGKADIREVEQPRPIAKGDFAVIDLETFEGGKRVDEMSAKGFTVPVGEEMLFAELDAALEGMKPGEPKKVQVDVPADAPGSRLAGRSFELDVNVTAVKEKILPPLTDEFAKEIGGLESVAELRDKVREDLERRFKEAAERQERESLITSLLAANPLELPQSLVAHESREMLQRALKDYEQRGVDPSNLDPARLWEEIRPAAERRIATELLLDAVAKAEEIAVDDAAVERFYEREAERAGAPVETVRQAYQRMGEGMRDRLRLDEAMQFLIREAEVKEVEPPKEGKA